LVYTSRNWYCCNQKPAIEYDQRRGYLIVECCDKNQTIGFRINPAIHVFSDKKLLSFQKNSNERRTKI
jgi:hypothetical protein